MSITSEEQRKALMALGAILWGADEREERWDWYAQDGYVQYGLILRYDKEPIMTSPMPVRLAGQVASILGLLPPSPVEGVEGLKDFIYGGRSKREPR